MLEADAVGIAEDDQGGGGDTRDVPFRPRERSGVQVREFLDQLREVLRVGRSALIRLLDRRAGEQLRSDRGKHFERHRWHPITGEGGGRDDELSYDAWMPDCELQCDAPA